MFDTPTDPATHFNARADLDTICPHEVGPSMDTNCGCPDCYRWGTGMYAALVTGWCQMPDCGLPTYHGDYCPDCTAVQKARQSS